MPTTTNGTSMHVIPDPSAFLNRIVSEHSPPFADSGTVEEDTPCETPPSKSTIWTSTSRIPANDDFYASRLANPRLFAVPYTQIPLALGVDADKLACLSSGVSPPSYRRGEVHHEEHGEGSNAVQESDVRSQRGMGS
jgi:hypothetical protein